MVPLKGPCCARCDKNQYCSNAGAAVSSIRFRSDCSLQGNLHNIPYVATVSENQYFNGSVAGVSAPESLYPKSFELSGRSIRILSFYQIDEQTTVQRRMPQ